MTGNVFDPDDGGGEEEPDLPEQPEAPPAAAQPVTPIGNARRAGGQGRKGRAAPNPALPPAPAPKPQDAWPRDPLSLWPILLDWWTKSVEEGGQGRDASDIAIRVTRIKPGEKIQLTPDIHGDQIIGEEGGQDPSEALLHYVLNQYHRFVESPRGPGKVSATYVLAFWDRATGRGQLRVSEPWPLEPYETLVRRLQYQQEAQAARGFGEPPPGMVPPGYRPGPTPGGWGYPSPGMADPRWPAYPQPQAAPAPAPVDDSRAYALVDQLNAQLSDLRKEMKDRDDAARVREAKLLEEVRVALDAKRDAESKAAIADMKATMLTSRVADLERMPKTPVETPEDRDRQLLSAITRLQDAGIIPKPGVGAATDPKEPQSAASALEQFARELENLEKVKARLRGVVAEPEQEKSDEKEDAEWDPEEGVMENITRLAAKNPAKAMELGRDLLNNPLLGNLVRGMLGVPAAPQMGGGPPPNVPST